VSCGVVSDGKLNIFGVKDVKRKKIPAVFKNIGKNHKNDGKTDIFTQNQFSTKSIFYIAITQKKITVNT